MVMSNVLDVLEERGYVEQITHREDLRELLAKGPDTFYNGFDGTAPSLTLGHLIPILSALHLYRAGHRPILVVGGGTTIVRDHSVRSQIRQQLKPDTSPENEDRIRD